MPRVPVYESQQVAPQAFQGLQQANTQPGAFGITLGVATENTGQSLIDTAQRLKTEDDDAKVKGAVSEFRSVINQRVFFDEDGYYNLRGRAAYEGYETTRKDLNKQLLSIETGLMPGNQQAKFKQYAQQYLDVELDQMSRHAATERQVWRDQEDLQIVKQAVEDGSLRWTDNAIYTAQIRKAIGGMALRHGWSPDEVQDKVDEAVTTMHMTAIQNSIQQKPEHARQYYEANKDEIRGEIGIDVLQAVMSATPLDERVDFLQWVVENPSAKMDPDVHQQAIKVLEARMNRDARIAEKASATERAATDRQRALVLSDLELAITRGEAGEDDIEAAWAKGIVRTASKRTELYKALDKDLERTYQAAEDSQRVLEHLVAGTPLDHQNAADRKLVDTWYTHSGIKPFTPEGNAQLAYIAAQLQVIPPAVLSDIRGRLRSGNAEQGQQAAQLVADLVDSAPMAVDQLGKVEKAVGLNTAAMIRAGTPAQTALELARKTAYELSASEREILAGRYREIRKGNADALGEFIDDDVDSWFTRQPQATDALLGEFEQATESYYMNTGDEATARKAAWTDLQRVWGQSTINGDREIMKYPPELRGVNRESFEQELKNAGIEATGIRVVSDAVTARDGSYPLFRDVDGLPMPVLNERNLPARWKPERIRTEDQDKGIAAARQKRALGDKLRAKYLRQQP